jgi:hypothetical protein
MQPVVRVSRPKLGYISMKGVCPNPNAWHQAFQRLCKHAKFRVCTPPVPPAPLILAGWNYSDDSEKMQRWAETVTWANTNGCGEIVDEIPEQDFYFI